MAENYKHLYEQMKKMLTQYQDELIPGFRKQIEELEETVVHQRKRADTAENFICTMCAECEWEVNDGILIMQKACCSWFPQCEKFKLRVTDNNVGGKWIPVTERLPDVDKKILLLCKNGAMFVGVRGSYYGGTEHRFKVCTALNSTKLLNKGRVTHWMPLPEPPKEVE